MHDSPGPFRDLLVSAFVDRLASSEPVPGGGSASAIAASLAGSLVAMVASLSEGRPKYADHAALHERVGAAGRRLADDFLTIADDDAAAYAAFSSALKLARDTDEQRAARTTTMRAAARRAAEVPLRCVEACVEVVAAAEALAGRSNVNAASDLHVASLLAEAAAEGAAANVRVNLPSVGDETWAAATESRLGERLEAVRSLAAATRTAVAAGSTREVLDVAAVAALPGA